VGLPVRITADFGELDGYFGFIKCDIEPPPDLHIPVLAARRSGKLKFDLKRKIGTWTTEEVKLAVTKGYVIHKIYEVLHYPETSPDLFKNYVRTFLKIKQEAAGRQKLGIFSEDDMDRYIQSYEEREGILLDREKIGEYNPGMYFIAKLCLNSLWGKLAQRAIYPETSDVFLDDDFQKLMHSDEFEVESVFLHSPLIRSVTYKKTKNLKKVTKNTNVAIAAYVTAYGRMRLYSVLDQISDDVLYMETDSVIFVDRGDCPLITGPFLGELTDELDQDQWITEYCSTGPKSYAYTTNTGKNTCKVKGFTLNHRNSEILNKDTMLEIVQGTLPSVQTEALKFLIGKDHGIESLYQKKLFRFTFDKREIRLGESENYIKTHPLC